MKDAYYFSHDGNARHDPKITAMRGVYGPRGYGWYWILVEMMRESEGYKLNIQGKYVYHAFASQMQCEVNEAQDFITDCINEFELFVSDEMSFWSASLLKRMNRMERKSESARKSAEARWKKETAPNKDSSSNSKRKKCDSNANASENDALKESKVKESKVKEIKQQEIKNETTRDIMTSFESEEDKLIFGSGPLPSVPDAYRMFEAEGFGTISDVIKDQLNDFIKDYSERWLCEAMKKAVFAGKRSLNYVGGTLKNWKAEGIDEPWTKEKPPTSSGGYRGNRNSGHSGKQQIEITKNDLSPPTPEEIALQEKMMAKLKAKKEAEEKERQEKRDRGEGLNH